MAAGFEVHDGQHEILAVRRPDPNPGKDLPGLDLIQFQKRHAYTPFHPLRSVYMVQGHAGRCHWKPAAVRFCGTTVYL